MIFQRLNKISTRTTKTPRLKFLEGLETVHGSTIKYVGGFDEDKIQLNCLVHGGFTVSLNQYQENVLSGGCGECGDWVDFSEKEVDAYCGDQLENQNGNPWVERVFAPLPSYPVYAVSSQGGRVYSRIEAKKTGKIRYLEFKMGPDHQLCTETTVGTLTLS